MKNKLFILDIDGTICKDGILSNSFLNELNELVSNGYNITFDTSRAPNFVNKSLNNINLKLPFISITGALLSTKHHIYNFIPINKDLKDQLIDVLCNNKIVFMCIFIENNKCRYCTINKNYFTKKRQIKILSLSELKQRENCIAIYCYCSNINIFTESNINSVNFNSFENSKIIQIVSKDANKGLWINELKKISNTDTIISFGNDKYDIEMLNESSIAFSVGKQLKSHKYINIPFDNGKKIIHIMKSLQ